MSTSTSGVVPSRNPLRRLYHWVLGWADTPYGTPALVALALVESSVFPIPPDVLLVALALAAPTRAFRFAAWCTVGSVVGGLLGYLIGMTLWDSLSPYMLDVVFSAEDFAAVAATYHEHGFWAVFVAAFTPIPYKVFTVAAGVVELDLGSFLAASVVGRGARFFLVALVIRAAGPRARQLLERYFEPITLLAAAALVGGFVWLKLG